MAIFDIHKENNESYYIDAETWEEAENRIPENHRVNGKVNQIIEDIPDSEIYQIVRCQ